MSPPPSTSRLRFWISRRGFWIESGEYQAGRGPWGITFGALLGLLLVFSIFAGSFYGVFSEIGLLRRFTQIDLAFLLPSLLAASGIVLMGSILRHFIPADGGRLAGLLVKSIGYAYLLYVLFHQAPSILGAFQAEPGIASLVESARPYADRLVLLDTFAILFVAGVALTRIAPLPWKHTSNNAVSAGLSILGFVLAGLAVREAIAAYASFYDTLADVGTILFFGFIVVGIGIALRPFTEGPNPIMAGIGQWAGHSQLRNFTLGGFLASYFLVIRPALFNTFVYAMIFEWILVVAIAWQLYSGLRSSIGQAYLMMPRPLPYDRWRRHEQSVSLTYPEFLPFFEEIQKEFLEEGLKDRLLTHVAITLWGNGLTQSQIAQIVHPIVEHRDNPVPRPPLPWETRWVNSRNRKRRQRLLDSTMETLNRVATEGRRLQLEATT